MGNDENKAMTWSAWKKARWRRIPFVVVDLLGPFLLYGFVSATMRGNGGALSSISGSTVTSTGGFMNILGVCETLFAVSL